MRRGEQGVDVGAHRVEGDVTEIEQPGEADYDVQAERQEHEQDREIRDPHPSRADRRESERQREQRERDDSRAGPRRSGVPFQACDRFNHALSPTRSPSSPEGRNTSTAISTMNANTS